MTTLHTLIVTGRIVDLMLIFVALEVVAILVWHRLTGRGIAARDLLPNVGAGVSLMLALRAVLTGSGWHWVAAWLVAALMFHVADLVRRWAK